VKEEAAAFAAGIEARLANLQSEIEKLRTDARAEMDAEGARIQRETERHLDRIREQAAQEIELLTRGAKDELRKYSAELAVNLAEQRIRAQMNPAMQQNLAQGFLHDMRKHSTLQAAN
jgi:F-type H+-transporting ATPase subunit b